MKKIIFSFFIFMHSALFCSPVILFDAKEQNLGKINQNKELQFIFTFINKGDMPLKILAVTPTCDCITMEESQDEIKPGAKGAIKGVFNSKKYTGSIIRSIFIRTNDPANENIDLVIKANILAKYLLNTNIIAIDKIKGKKDIIKNEITIESVQNEPIEINEIKTSHNYVSVKIIKKDDLKTIIEVLVNPLKIPKTDGNVIFSLLTLKIKIKNEVEEERIDITINDDRFYFKKFIKTLFHRN